MKNYIAIVILLLFSNSLIGQQATNAVVPIERHSFSSQILEEERTFQVYLPPSYFNSEKGNFPVIYLMDGDYNFYYDTGMIEFLSSVSNQIPEMILVGISDKGSTKYRDYCRPNTNNENGGNADKFMAFLKEELKPMIDKKYRTSDYDILIGHSMGGLFVANHYLEQPEGFDTFISIDPSLWWSEYAMTEKADSIFKNKKELTSNLFISLANSQGMGVRGFVGVLDKYFPYDTKWNFKHYENHTHGSVHMIAIQEALLKLFKDWEVTRPQFYSFKSAQDLMDHYKKINKEFSSSFTLPAYNFGNMMNFYYRKNLTEDIALLETEIEQHFPNSMDEFFNVLAGYELGDKKYEAAEKTYQKCLAKRPNSYRAYEGLSKIYTQKEDLTKAKEASELSIKLAKKAHARQWQLNELQSNLDHIINLSKK